MPDRVRCPRPPLAKRQTRKLMPTYDEEGSVRVREEKCMTDSDYDIAEFPAASLHDALSKYDSDSEGAFSQDTEEDVKREDTEEPEGPIIATDSAPAQLAYITAAQVIIDPYQDPFKARRRQPSRAAGERGKELTKQVLKMEALSWEDYYNIVKQPRDKAQKQLQVYREYWEPRCAKEVEDAQNLRDENERLLCETAKLEEKLSDERNRVQELEKEKVKLQDRNNELVEEVEKTKGTLDNREQELKRLKQRGSETKASLRHELDEAEKENHDLREASKELKSINANLLKAAKDHLADRGEMRKVTMPPTSTTQSTSAVTSHTARAPVATSMTPASSSSTSKRPRTSSDLDGRSNASPPQCQKKSEESEKRCEDLQRTIYLRNGTIETQKSALEHLQGEQAGLRADLEQARDEAKDAKAGQEELEALKAEVSRLRNILKGIAQTISPAILD